MDSRKSPSPKKELKMPRAAKTPKAVGAPVTGASPADEVRVAVVGGGLAGLTSTLQLAQRGFKVTLYEAADTLGGNFSSQEVNGVYHDVYPHMFCDWYSNFWELFRSDLKFKRNEHFEPRMGVKLMNKGVNKGSPTYRELQNATSIPSIWANLRSGVSSFSDMFLLGFSMLDLAATPFDRSASDELEQLDVNAFIYSKGYTSNEVASLQNYMLMVIWSIRSETTAAASYQDFIKHTLMFPHPTPFAWLLKGSLSEKIITPFENMLVTLKCDIQKGKRVRSVELIDGKIKLMLETTKSAKAEGGRRRIETKEAPRADYVVLAVPAPELAKLVMDGAPGARIVDKVPRLSELRRLSGEAIPVVDVYFNKKLPDMPKEQVALMDSDCELTVLDISQLWTGDGNMEGRTALVLAASNGYALPSARPLEQGHLMIQMLHDYLPVFEPGERWGDPRSDICWERTHFRSNDGNKLFVNEVGSWEVRPVASYPDALPNVFFAGDFCQTDVDMATIEAAVQSGLNAAQAVLDQDAKEKHRPRGKPITLAKHQVHSQATFLAAKLALLPLAYLATARSNWDAESTLTKGPLPANRYSTNAYSLLLPLAFTLDWWKTAYWLARRLAPSPGDTGVDPSDTLIGWGAKGLSAASDVLHKMASSKPPGGEGSATPSVSSALSTLASQAWRTAQAAYAAGQAKGSGQEADPEPYQRRWRAKR
jgi:Flavin containing amine oxidoreductase